MSDHIPYTDEMDMEAQPGLPEPLPDGERLLWQGQPDTGLLARHVFHVRKVGAYFGLLALWQLATGLHDGVAHTQVAINVGILVLAAAVAIGLLWLLARATAHEAVYSLTDQRLIMRIGVAFGMNFNIPFVRIQGASLRPLQKGFGDIALQLEAGNKVSYAILWPHARAWRLRAPEPTLRCIPEAEHVVRLMSTMLSGTSVDRPAVVVGDDLARAGVPV
ncbi:MAG: photosynthetic complex putative assembly protein PuhB [Pseudomonadota bacterium]